MQVKVVPHSTLQHLFVGKQDHYMVQIDSYSDLISYLKHVHPKFDRHMREIDVGLVASHVAILDSKFNPISVEDVIKSVDEVVYICPTFAGAKGKGLRFLAAVALFVAVAATGGFAAVAAGGSLTFLQKVAVNIGLALISSLFQQETGGGGNNAPSDGKERKSGLFGGLTINTEQGAVIPVRFGRVRVAGQLVSLYIDTITHGEDDVVRMSDITGTTQRQSVKNTGEIIVA